MDGTRDTHNASGTPLGAVERSLLQDSKLVGISLNSLLTEVGRRNHALMPAMLDSPAARQAEADAHRSNDALFEARRALQTGLMWLNRAIANPEGF